MKVLLVNPNKYKQPPVPPIGLEYLYGRLHDTKHQLHFIDLCFSDNNTHDLLNCINDFKPDIACISIRQIDTVLFRDNIFFLDDIMEYTTLFHHHGIKVILGGSGFSIMPEHILKYTNADYGITGPGDTAITELLDNIGMKKPQVNIINGYQYFKNHKIHRSKRILISDYKKYLEHGGIGGFRTQTGCFSSCFFCTEGYKPVYYYSTEDITNEINSLIYKGVRQFHLCDSEFNQNIDHSKNVCRAIIEKCPPVNWFVYMKLYPFDTELFNLMASSGINLITLSLDTKKDTRENFQDIEKFFSVAEQNNIKTVVDLSVGYPEDNIKTIQEIITFLDNQSCQSIGINSYYRLYPGIPLLKMIESKKDSFSIIQNKTNDLTYLFPVFFNAINEDQLFTISHRSKKTRVEGFDKTVNYLRV